MKLHNITFDYSQNDYADNSGDAQYSIERQVLQAVKDLWEKEFSTGWVYQELRELLVNSVDNDDSIDFSTVDLFCCICETLINYLDKGEYTINVSYDHIIWLFHDISHITNDCGLGEINIDEWGEQKAIENSIDCLNANSIAIPFDILATTNREYAERFNTSAHFVEYARQYQQQLPSTISLSMFE